jgi:hypothetical protein
MRAGALMNLQSAQRPPTLETRPAKVLSAPITWPCGIPLPCCPRSSISLPPSVHSLFATTPARTDQATSTYDVRPAPAGPDEWRAPDICAYLGFSARVGDQLAGGGPTFRTTRGSRFACAPCPIGGASPTRLPAGTGLRALPGLPPAAGNGLRSRSTRVDGSTTRRAAGLAPAGSSAPRISSARATHASASLPPPPPPPALFRAPRRFFVALSSCRIR